MDFYLIERYLKVYNNESRNNNKTIGSVIKHYRKERSLTLEETSNDICSISYLCKVEKNQLVPSEKILPKLMERLEINEDIFTYNSNHDWIETIMKEEKVSNKLFDSVKNKSDYQSKLISFAYTTFNFNDTKKSNMYFNDLNEYFEYFKIEELNFYLYLIMKNLYKVGKYTNVLKIHEQIKYTPNNEHVIIQSEILYTKSLFKLNRDKEASEYLSNLYRNLIDLNQLDKIFIIKNYEISSQAKVVSTDELKDILFTLNGVEKYNFDYIWFCHNYFKLKHYDKAFVNINKIKDQNAHYYIMYLITLDKLSKKMDLESEFLKPSFNGKLPTSYSIVQKYLRVKYEDTGKFKFIKKEILINKDFSQEHVVVDYLFSQATNYLKSKHYYKETVKLLERKSLLYNESMN